MLKLSIEELISKIKNREIFTAISNDNSFSIAIEAYVPYICLAIHNGGNLRPELKNKIALNKLERWLEEDPITGSFISSLPIRIISYDSRFEYDLNRSPEECIYEEAWGKKVWKTPLSEEEKRVSLERHANFYKVLHVLIECLRDQFHSCIVYDIHSYNYKREGRYSDVPVFNIGTEKIKNIKFQKYIKRWIKELNNIQIDSVNVITEENKVFYGRGYLLAYVLDNFPEVLVLATEIKKIYIDEINGDEYPEIIETLQKGLKLAILNHVSYFAEDMTNLVFDKKYELLSSGLSDTLKLVDTELYRMLKKVEILDFINPINIEAEKKKFFTSKYKMQPEFRYKPLPFDINAVKRELYHLPTEKIKDIHLKLLYEEIINIYVKKLELLILRGQKEFLYSSLINFGEPDENDISNANFLIHCYSEKEPDERLIDSTEALKIITKIVDEYGFKCHIELVKNLASGAMVVNSTKTLKLRKEGKLPISLANGLAHHEIGIHMLTTINSTKQPLKFLRLGTPNNTVTQEGLAILSEYLSGNLDINRLKHLALRVLAITYMLKEYSFKEVFKMLVETYDLDQESAFYLTTRVFRGGGFTKDYLYLKGFKMMYDYYQSGEKIEPLLLGKCSLSHKNIIEELMHRKDLLEPAYIPSVFSSPKLLSSDINYIIKSLK